MIDHKVFNYQRIGKQRVDANTRLTEDEKDLLDTLSFALTQTRDLAKIAEIRAKIDRLTNKPEPLEFEATPVAGYSLEGLVLNEDRPNVSFRVKREGFVDISKRVEGTPFENVLPHGYPTFIYRTYTVIRDGIRNMDLLPVVDLSEHDRKVLSCPCSPTSSVPHARTPPTNPFLASRHAWTACSGGVQRPPHPDLPLLQPYLPPNLRRTLAAASSNSCCPPVFLP